MWSSARRLGAGAMLTEFWTHAGAPHMNETAEAAYALRLSWTGWRYSGHVDARVANLLGRPYARAVAGTTISEKCTRNGTRTHYTLSYAPRVTRPGRLRTNVTEISAPAHVFCAHVAAFSAQPKGAATLLRHGDVLLLETTHAGLSNQVITVLIVCEAA
jgi:hypothetical protein